MEICVGFEAHARILIFFSWVGGGGCWWYEGKGVAGALREMSKLVTIYM